MCRRDGTVALVNITRPGDSDSSDEADTLQASLQTRASTVVLTADADDKTSQAAGLAPGSETPRTPGARATKIPRLGQCSSLISLPNNIYIIFYFIFENLRYFFP